MVNIKVKKAVKKTVKSSGSSPAKKSSKQKHIRQERNLSVKKTTKVVAQRKPSNKNSNKGVYKVKDTLKIRRTNINELKKVENVIEKLSHGPEPTVQKTVPVVQETAPTVKRTVPGVLRIVHDVKDTVPGAPKAIPIVEIKNYFKKLLVGSNA